MARFVDKTRVHWDPPEDRIYSDTLRPGQINPRHGIYVCDGCGREIALPTGHEAPTQNHHQHPTNVGSVGWRLLVIADGQSDAERVSARKGMFAR